MNRIVSCLTIAAMGLASLAAAHAQDPAGQQRGVERPPQAEPTETSPPAPRPPAFEDLDTNADGAIGKDEAAVDPPLAQAFGTLDKDADGRLTPEEYAAYVLGTP